jgi:uncharacterized membrane protein
MSVAAVVFITTFLASAVEAIEMITIVIGVGATRGWRSTFLGAATGFAVLAVVVALAGAALAAVPIGALRFVVGALLLTFGLQWFRKGILRVAARGLAGIGEAEPDDSERWHGRGVDWTAFVLSFKGVVLEGLEVGFIVVSFGATANQYEAAILGGVSAIVTVGAVGLAANQLVGRIPRSLLQLIVGIMLTTFGTFWSLEGLGVEWPASDAAILALLGLYAISAFAYTSIERRRFHPAPEAPA